MGLINEKIFHFRKKTCGYTQEKFAKIGETSVTSLFNYEKGINTPGGDFIATIKNHFGDKLDLNWLLNDSIPVEPPIEMMVAELKAPYGYTDEEKKYIRKLIEIFRYKKKDTITAIKNNINVCLDTPDAEEKPAKKKE
ncbi:MAG: helix-turn-helix domain-containing protein [Nitrospinae bacterium]|nr:helix-turn-helix domain-containing protein [Nitrospinota bacterium]